MSDRESAVAPAAGPSDSIEGIQYLRGIAALMVVFHHARWFFPSSTFLYEPGWSDIGSRGVDVFFVISGFVMAHSTRSFGTGTLARSRGEAGDFLLKRLIRVAPLYWLATLWTARHLLWQGGANLNLAKDFLFVPHFNTDGPIWPLLFQGWTINYEMFFYLIFALSLLCGRHRAALLTAALLVLAAWGVVLDSSLPQAHYASTVFYTSNLLLEFVMGVWLLRAVQRVRVRVPRLWSGLGVLAGLALLAIPNLDIVRGLADGVAAVVVVGCGVLWARGTRYALFTRLGDASYSIYLFHMTTVGAAVLLRRWIGLSDTSLPGIVAGLGVHLLVATALGFVVYRFIEQPMLRVLRRRLLPRPSPADATEHGHPPARPPVHAP